MSSPTPHPDVNALLDDLLARIQAVLGAKLVGLYLYGSLVTGDFDPGISDVDLLAALGADLTGDEAEALARMHEALVRERPAWENRIEVAYLSTAALARFREQRDPLGIVSPGEPFHVIDAGDDWLMNWYVVREQGMALFGPPPAAVIPPIAKEEFITAVRDHARAWRGWIDHYVERKAQAYAMLTMCRALYAVRHGRQASKRQAAHWVAESYPEWAELVLNALAWRSAWRTEDVDHAATRADTARFIRWGAEWMESES